MERFRRQESPMSASRGENTIRRAPRVEASRSAADMACHLRQLHAAETSSQRLRLNKPRISHIGRPDRIDENTPTPEDSGESPFKKIRVKCGSPSRITADTTDCPSGDQNGLTRNAGGPARTQTRRVVNEVVWRPQRKNMSPMRERRQLPRCVHGRCSRSREELRVSESKCLVSRLATRHTPGNLHRALVRHHSTKRVSGCWWVSQQCGLG